MTPNPPSPEPMTIEQMVDRAEAAFGVGNSGVGNEWLRRARAALTAHEAERVQHAVDRETMQELLRVVETTTGEAARLREALVAARQFVWPDVSRGPGVRGWQNTMDLIDAALTPSDPGTEVKP